MIRKYKKIKLQICTKTENANASETENNTQIVKANHTENKNIVSDTVLLNNKKVRFIETCNEKWYCCKDINNAYNKIINFYSLVDTTEASSYAIILKNSSSDLMKDISVNSKFVNQSGFEKVIKYYDEMLKSNITELNETYNNNELVNANINNFSDIFKLFKYHNKDIVVLFICNEYWFKGKNIADLLGYVDTDQKLRKYLEDYEKKTFGKLKTSHPVTWTGNENVPSKAIFINESGLYSLIFNSKTEEAKTFKKWITYDLLPSLRKYGSYSINYDKHEYKSFYNDNAIYDYDNKLVLYIGYIGEINNESIFKYGQSNRIFKRDYIQHRKNFDIFELLFIIECDNKDEVEFKFEQDLKCKNLHRCLKINGHVYKELFTVSDIVPYNKIEQSLTNLVKNLQLPSIKEKEQEINKLTIEYNQKIKEIEKENEKALLMKDIEHYKKENVSLRNENDDLRKKYNTDVSYLHDIIENDYKTYTVTVDEYKKILNYFISAVKQY